MADPDSPVARSAFVDLLVPSPARSTPSGIRVMDRSALGIAMVHAREGRAEALAARVQALYGVPLPTGPRRAAKGDVAFVGTGPDGWLATCEGGSARWAGDLTTQLADLASVADQSSGYAVLRIGGVRARDMLAKGVFLDLHPHVFSPGCAASTVVAHISVTLWQLDDVPTYEFALFRSLAGSFWHWLSTGGTEFGLEIVPESAPVPAEPESSIPRPTPQQSL